MLKKKLIIIGITIIITVSSIYWFSIEENSEKKYWTMDEVFKQESVNIQEPVSRQKYHVKDKVIYIQEIKIPEYSVKYFNESGNDQGERRIIFNTNESVSLLAVGFKSLENDFAFFKNNENHSFDVGEYNTFKLPLKKFPAHSFYKTEDDYWMTVEPHYFIPVIYGEYLSNIIADDIDIVNLSKEIYVDNVTNSFHCNMTFNSVSDFYPYPVRWNDVNIRTHEGPLENNFGDHQVKVYHEENYLGRLDSNDSGMDKFIESGDRIEIAGFNYSGIKQDINLILETDHPSYIESESASMFIIAPYYEIYFGDG